MADDTPLMFELLEEDVAQATDANATDFYQLLPETDDEETQDFGTQPILLLGLNSQLPLACTATQDLIHQQRQNQSSALPLSPVLEPPPPPPPVAPATQPAPPTSSKPTPKTSKRGRPPLAKAAKTVKKTTKVKNVRLNGVWYPIRRRDVDTLELVGDNVQRIAALARDKGPLGNMRSLVLQLGQVETLLKVLGSDELPSELPDELWREMLRAVYDAFYEAQTAVQLVKIEAEELVEVVDVDPMPTTTTDPPNLLAVVSQSLSHDLNINRSEQFSNQRDYQESQPVDLREQQDRPETQFSVLGDAQSPNQLANQSQRDQRESQLTESSQTQTSSQTLSQWRLEKESPELRSTMRLARCHFSLGPFVRCGLLASGRDNVTVRLQPRVDTGSLTSSGCIEDGAGALHRSIGHWIRAAHGLNFYRMPVAQRRTLSVQYHGRDLAPILFPLPPSDEPPTSRLDPVSRAVGVDPQRTQEAPQTVPPPVDPAPRPASSPTAETRPEEQAGVVVEGAWPDRRPVPDSMTRHITKIRLIDPSLEFYRSCPCEEDLYRGGRWSKRLLQELTDW